jgi:hypothetical protein
MDFRQTEFSQRLFGPPDSLSANPGYEISTKSGSCPTITKIIEEECKKGRSSANGLKGGSRRRKGSMVRARIAKRGVDELGLSMAEIARHVGVTKPTIVKAVARLEEEGGL